MKLDFPVLPGESRVDIAYTMPRSTPSDFDVKTFYKGNSTKLVAPVGVTMKAEGMKNLGPETPHKGYDLRHQMRRTVTVQVDGTGALSRGGDDQQSADSGGQSQLMQILPRLYQNADPAGGFAAAVLSVKWILLLAFGILGLGFTLLYRKVYVDDAIVLEGVWKYFGDYPAIRNVSFRLAQSQCLALIGRNGAGKTTLLRMLGGFSRPAQGVVRISGGSPRETTTRRSIGIIGHGISVYDELSAMENLRLFGRMYGLTDPESRAEGLLDRVGLGRVKDGLVREFSRGMRQRLAIARAFIHDPSVLLLDEPFTSLDDRAIAVLQSLLAEASERGASIVMSTHQLREAMELATQVILLERGQLVFSGPRTEEMIADPGWVYTHYGNKGA